MRGCMRLNLLQKRLLELLRLALLVTQKLHLAGRRMGCEQNCTGL